MALVAADSEKYDVLEIIGRGAFGIIRKVRRKNDGHILCRKEINYIKMSQKEREQLTAEFTILSSLRHDNIVGYFQREHLKQTQELYLYMEYCGGGDLGMVIKNLKKTGEFAKEEFVWRIFSQLITALYRCHYGIDAPEPGSDLSRQRDPRTALKNKNQATMILHRDLKPENIFLGDDQSVKLGDFGLSKLMQSHDFASTYVGTPFYMSPEICAAEKYTLQSDVWSVGCIMYELCTHEPPFNANSHLQLVQRIRKGDFKSLPSVYSKDLRDVIASCLKTNPLHRPDTASLLTIPYVWIARKSQEIVKFGTALKTREEIAEYKLKQAEERLSALEADRATMRAEIEAQVRREWEVKAQLEITRQVQSQVQTELERLRRKFDKEVDEKVKMLREKDAKQNQDTQGRAYSRALRENPIVAPAPAVRRSDLQLKENINPQSSITTASGEEDFPSTTDITDLSDLSIHSPSTSTTSRPALPQKRSKTPFTRSKTTFDSPADIQMAEPSPMSISSLALSPRRNPTAQAAAAGEKTTFSGKNIFAEAARGRRNWVPTLAYTSDESENDDDVEGSDEEILEQLSPTRPKGIPGPQSTDPFKMPPPVVSRGMPGRPGLIRQNTTATMQGMAHKPSLFPTTGTSKTAELIRAGIAAVGSGIPRSTTDTDLRVKATSPNRMISKIPSRQDLNGNFTIATDATATGGLSRSPSRKAVGAGLVSKLGGAKQAVANGTGSDDLAKAVHPKNVHGQVTTAPVGGMVGGRTLVELAQARAGGRPINGSGQKGAGPWHERDLPPVPVWDVDVCGEEGMPSPFLKRDYRIRGLR